MLFSFIKGCIQDIESSDEVVRGALGLLGDVCDAFPASQIRPQILENPWIQDAIRAGRISRNSYVKEIARWVKEVSVLD